MSNATSYTVETLSAMNASEVRTIARKCGMRGAAMLTLSKSELITRIVTGNFEAPSVEPPAPVTAAAPVKAGKVHTLEHFNFEKLLRVIAGRVNAALVGPAGTGKTRSVENVAKTLGLSFFSQSCSSQTTKSDFFGFIDATGNYKRSLFREAYENGGVFLVDEADAGNANVLTAINAALSNKVCAFPDGMVSKHDNFVCVIAMNTFGRGADRMYVGRNQLDAATLNRFAVISWDYDEKLELHLASNKDYAKHVQKIRRAIFATKERVVASTRNIIEGSKLLEAGFTMEEIDDMLIFQHCDESLKSKILAGI
mgnify:FL=1